MNVKRQTIAGLVACLLCLVVLTGTPAARAEVVNTTMPPAPLGSAGYIQQAYGLTALSASSGYGNTVAIVVLGSDYRNLESDLSAFRSRNGLPPCTTVSGCLRIVNQKGKPAFVGEHGIVSGYSGEWRWETALDVQAVSALCPNCRILVVQARSATGTFAKAEATAYRLGADQISHSFHWGDYPAQDFTFNGVASVGASGDDGHFGREAVVPAMLPDVSAAAGTTLLPASYPTARGVIETAWDKSGSSCSPAPQPSWQAGVVGGCTTRATGDVSAVADPNTGLIINCTCEGSERKWTLMGGTSLSSPLIAAFYGLVASKKLGLGGAGWAYRSGPALNDITAGSNGDCSNPVLCQSAIGYDGPTGNGSISSSVVPGAPGVSRGQGCFCIGDPGTYILTQERNSVILSGGVFPNLLPTSYWWETYSEDGKLLQRTTAKSIGAGAEPVLVQDAISGIDPLRDHFALVAQNSMGTVSYSGKDGFKISAVTRTDLAPRRSRAPLTTIMFLHKTAWWTKSHLPIQSHQERREVTISFEADRRRVSFKCSIDGSAYRPCSSPVSYQLGRGRHQLRVFGMQNQRRGPADSFSFHVGGKRTRTHHGDSLPRPLWREGQVTANVIPVDLGNDPTINEWTGYQSMAPSLPSLPQWSDCGINAIRLGTVGICRLGG